MRRISFSRFAWGLLFYNLVVIVWGAFVRASFSGDGCGAHWPNCGATLIPSLQHRPQIIEFIHRVSSGIVLPLESPRSTDLRSFGLGLFLASVDKS